MIVRVHASPAVVVGTREDPGLERRVGEHRLADRVRRVEVLFVPSVVDREGVGLIVELALLVGLKRRLGEVAREADEIAHRVVVLEVVEAMNRDASGI
jgi:hypothetical protein